MPQSSSYKVTTAPPPVAPLPTRTPVHQDVHIPDTRGCKKHFSCSWCFCYLVGVLSLAFVLCVAFVPSTGIFPIHVELYAFSVPLHRQGHLQVYPPLIDFETVSRLRIKNLYAIHINESTVKDAIVPALRNILREYPSLSSQQVMNSYVHCWLENPTNPNKPCYFDIAWLGSSCSEANKFGYEAINDTLNPCVLLRIEDAKDWKPTVFSHSEAGSSWIKDYDPGFFGVGCRTVDTSKHKKVKEIRTFPKKGFSLLYFPESQFNNTVYRRPLVMVQVVGLKKGSSVTVECWVRARNAFVLEDSGNVRITFSQEPEL